MGVKDDLFSFRGLAVTALHNLFVLGLVFAGYLSVWIWTGANPISGQGSQTHEKQY
jgi:hypothetical protein